MRGQVRVRAWTRASRRARPALPQSNPPPAPPRPPRGAARVANPGRPISKAPPRIQTISDFKFKTISNSNLLEQPYPLRQRLDATVILALRRLHIKRVLPVAPAGVCRCACKCVYVCMCASRIVSVCCLCLVSRETEVLRGSWGLVRSAASTPNATFPVALLECECVHRYILYVYKYQCIYVCM